MLKLDEKKIRKGKPVGLPYVGSKKKISKKIVEIIKQNFCNDKTVYDLFGGGGAITAELMINGIDVIYNDLDKTITDMFNRVLSQEREWIKTLIVSRDEFIEIRDKENKSVDDELKLLVNSFGDNRKGYLYSKEISDIKYNLAVEIIEKEDVFSGYKKTTTYQNFLFNYENYSQQLERLQRLERLEQLPQLQQLERLQQLDRLPKTTNEDYHYFSNVRDSILYLDPPYENSIGYINEKSRKTSKEKYEKIRNYLIKNTEVENIVVDNIEYKIGKNTNNKNRMYEKDLYGVFKSKEFYDWAYEMSQNNIVLLSSYEVSDPRFECVYEFNNARSAFSVGNNGKRTEKLFMVKS